MDYDYVPDNQLAPCLVTVDGGGNAPLCDGWCDANNKDWANSEPDPEPHSIDDPMWFGINKYSGDKF